VTRLTRIIGPLLQATGLDVRPVSGADGEVHELVVTNPGQPDRGRVIVDRYGLMEWDYWGQLRDDAGAADLAAVITAIMATRFNDQSHHRDQVPRPPGPTEDQTPHP
jgi:hypothetical protein